MRTFFRECFEPDIARRAVRTADRMRRLLPDLSIHAEWLLWRKTGYLVYWEGYEVAAGRRTGVKYVASVGERPRLGKWEAEVKRAMPGGELRAWPNVSPVQGTQRQAVYPMVRWMRSITANGKP